MKTTPEIGNHIIWLLQAQEEAHAAERHLRKRCAEFYVAFDQFPTDRDVRDLRNTPWAVDEGRRRLHYREDGALRVLPLLDRVVRGAWVLLLTNAPHADHIALARFERKVEEL